MPNVAYSISQLAFIQIESTFGIAPNSSGTASVAGSNACLITQMSLDPVQALIDRPDKTGSLDYLAGSAGRRICNWTIRLALAGNGAAGVAPDIGPILQCLFGQAPVVVASTSVTYSLADLSPSFTIYNFRNPGTVTQQVAIGCVVDSATFNLGDDVSFLELSGTGLWVLDTDQFSTADSIAKGGLTTFPSEPASPVTNGNFAVGFRGQVTLDGNVYSAVRSSKVVFKANREIPNDIVGLGYGSLPAQGRREITGTCDIYDDDSANLSSLKVKAFSAAPITAIYQIGNVAGNTWTLTARNVQNDPPKYNDSQKKWSTNWTWKAHASAATSKDSVTLAIT